MTDAPFVTTHTTDADREQVRTTDYHGIPILIQATGDEITMTTSRGEEATALPVRILAVQDGEGWVETLVFWTVVRDQLSDGKVHLGNIAKPEGKRYYRLNDVADPAVEAAAREAWAKHDAAPF